MNLVKLGKDVIINLDSIAQASYDGKTVKISFGFRSMDVKDSTGIVWNYLYEKAGSIPGLESKEVTSDIFQSANDVENKT